MDYYINIMQENTDKFLKSKLVKEKYFSHRSFYVN
jgi:hypothetical protein